jgi:putative transposase
MAIKKEILDELLKDRDPKTMFSSEGLLGELKKALAERVLNAEMDHHLADSTQDEVSEGDKPANHRNGYSKKTVLTENEALELSIPRDRRGSFEPQLIAKYQRRFPGFDDKIISMYARGMSVREIQGHLRELYGIEASPQLISTVTDAVLEEVSRWQSRPLDPLYARAADAEAAATALRDFEDGPWGQRFAAITALWRRHWAHVIPFFAYPQEVRKMIYTTQWGT